MKLLHLAMTVRDREASRHFYEELFGFNPASVRYFEDGVVIVGNDHDFQLAFKDGNPRTEPDDFFHIGFAVDSRAEVNDLQERIETLELSIVENDDEPGFRAFKFLDLDGYKVQVYWNE